MMKRKILCAALALITALPCISTINHQPNFSLSAAAEGMDGIVSGMTYRIRNEKSSLYLTVDADGNVCQQAEGVQNWMPVRQADGSYLLTCGSLALTVADGSDASGANIYAAPQNGSNSQKFHIHSDAEGFWITSVCSDDVCAVEIKGKSNNEGANVQQYKYQANPNQRFFFEQTAGMLRGDLDGNGRLNAADLTLMKRALLGTPDTVTAGIMDVSGDGQADSADARMLRDYLLQIIDTFPEPYAQPEIPDIPEIPDTPNEGGRYMEYLNRGVNAVSNGRQVLVSWRSLADDPKDIAFNVYRTTDGRSEKLNSQPLTGGTNFTDTTANLSKQNTYFVKAVVSGKETDTDGSFSLTANPTAGAQIINIKKGGLIHFVWVGDFDGDGSYDYLVDRCADNHQKLEAYRSDGTYLWTVDLGYNSENKNNISPGASTVDVGMWDGVTVYDMDCDGYADVLVRIADGVIFGDGKTYKNTITNGQAIAVIDGRTGALKADAPVPDDFIKVGPMACMMEIGYLDGVHPSVVCWMKNRNKDKTFNSITAAFGYENGKFQMHWKYKNDILFTERTEYKNGYAEAHQIRVADVDYDGKDEVLHMGYCLNGDGSLRYHIDEIVHGDRWFVGSFCNANNGKEMYGYGVQQKNQYGLLEYIYNASTGKMLWTNYTKSGALIDVGRGNVGDVDPRYDGFECWSFQGLYNMNGKKIGDQNLYPSLRLWWDGDLFAESYNDGKIEKWDYQNSAVQRLVSTWKVTDCTGSERGASMFYGDILGDWREEVVMTSSDYSKLVILSTTSPTDVRLYSLAQNPCYRNCMTAKGYYQSHMLDYFLGNNMEMPDAPKLNIIQKAS